MAQGLQTDSSRIVVAGTGHRPQKLNPLDPSDRTFGFSPEAHEALLDVAREALARVRDSHPDKEITVVSGVTLGYDQALAMAALESDMRVVAAVPFKGQESRWGRESQVAYRQLLDRIAAAGGEVHVVSPGGYTPAKMQARNEWMVDRADIVLALHGGHAGGTASCIEYARQQGKEVINVWDSYERRVTRGRDRPGRQVAERAQTPRPPAAERGKDETGPLRIVHVKDHLDGRGGSVVYVGRRMPAYGLAASPLANNFEVGRDGTRDEVRGRYRDWLRAEFRTEGSPAREELIRVRDLALSGADASLSYWASGNECHADIVREAVLKLVERERARDRLVNEREGQERGDGRPARDQPGLGAEARQGVNARQDDSRRRHEHVASHAAHQAREDVLGYSRGTDNLRELYEVSDGRTRAEHASYLNERSQSARDAFERGASIYEDVLVVPREYDAPRGEANITTHQYAASFVGGFIADDTLAKEKAAELVRLAEQISGQWADAQSRIAVFKHLYDQVSLDEHGRVRSNADRPEALERTLGGARELAAEMARLEPRDFLSETDEHELTELYEHETAGHERDYQHDENSVYAQMYEDAVAASHEGAEHEQIEVETRGGGPLPEVSYERVSLTTLPPQVPDGVSRDSEARLFEVTLPEVDRRVESAESRRLIMKEVVYSEHGREERADKAARITRAFTAASREDGRDAPPSRREQLNALSTLHVLAAAEAAREGARYAPDALRWARDYYSRTEPEAHASASQRGQQFGAAHDNPAARDLHVANEKDIRLAQQRLLRLDRVPTREGFEHVENLERAAANIAGAIERLRPTAQERAAALDVVASRITAAISAESQRLLRFEQATAARASVESRLGRPLAHDSLREHLRDELHEADRQIESARKEYLAQLGHVPDTPAQAREAVAPRLQSLDRALQFVNAEREATGVERAAEPAKTAAQNVFVSLNNDPGHRLPVENVREHGVVTRMAEACHLRLNTWHGLNGREITGASEERDLVARFVGNYIDYRMQDAGTRMLNQSAEYREYSRRLDSARTVEELRAAAKEIRQENYQRGEQFKAHLRDPQGTERPEHRALPAHEMRNLFLSPAPAHYTAEMRDLRRGMSVTGRDKEKLIRGLERGEITPPQNLASLLCELDGRRTPEALSHFSASLATPADQMRRPSQTDLHAVHQKLLPYEKDYLYRQLEAKRDEFRERIRQDRTQEVVGRETQEHLRPSEATLSREEARALTASQTFREYYAAASWREAELFTADHARRDGRMAPSESRSTIVNGVTDRHVEAAGYIVNNLDVRKAQDVAAYLKSSQDESLRTAGEIVEVFSNARHTPTADGRVEVSLRPPEASRVTDREWEYLLGSYHPDRAAENKYLRERLPASHLSEIRRDAQVAAWKEMEPQVRATTYRTDSRAEVLYNALEVRDALNNTRSLQDRARTAHHAVEAHVERCAAAVEKALANPIAIHRASPEALRVAGHITRAGSMVASMAGIQPVAKTLNWAGQNLQRSAASAAHVREFGGVERTAKDVETTRHLVRAALDPAYAKTQEALISRNEEQFSFVRETVTPKQQSQYNSLDRHARRTKDEYLRSFGELDSRQQQLAEAQRRDADDRGLRREAGQSQGQQTRSSPSRELYNRHFESREADLLGQRLEELIQAEKLPARDARAYSQGQLVRDLVPRSEREAIADHARDEAWREMTPAELTGDREHVDERVLGRAAEVADLISHARQAEAELLAAREAAGAGGDGPHAERVAAAEANVEHAFAELDRGRASLDVARDEAVLAERTERFNEIQGPLERGVREYLDAAYREDGLEAFRDADLAEEHVAGLSEAMHDCIRGQGTTLEQLNLNEKDVEQIARDLVGSLSNTLDRTQAHELHRDMMQGVPVHGAGSYGRNLEMVGHGAAEQHAEFTQEHSARARNGRDEHTLPDRDGGGMRPRDVQHEHTEGVRGMELREATKGVTEHVHDFAFLTH